MRNAPLQFLVLALVSLFPIILHAQPSKSELEWGEVPIEQLKMKTFPADTNANVVVLFDYGTTRFDSHFDLIFERHCRIKILNKAGFDWGTIVLSYYAGKRGERISKIDGVTIALGPDGKIVQNELESDAIFEEELEGDRRRIRFTLPALSEGCVIEFKYRRTSENPQYLPNWEFQKSEPVLWSEYKVETPSVYQYVAVTYGALSYVISEAKHETKSFTGPSGAMMLDMQILHYAMRDVPALRTEPYITTLDDYSKKVVFQLAMVAWPGHAPQRFIESWSKLIEELLKEGSVGKQLKSTRDIADQTKALTGSVKDPLERMSIIYDFIRNGIACNGSCSYFTHDDLDHVLETKKGNVGEVNYLLTTMLREAGIEADPVLLSTRDHGMVQKVWPVYSQFNYAIVRAKVGFTTYLLDATERMRPYELLPARALNHEGLLLKEGPETWIPLNAEKKSFESTTIELNLAADGQMHGTVVKVSENYRAISERESVAGQKEEDYVKAILKTETMGIAADSFSFANKDDVKKPFEMRAKFSSATYAQVLDDFIYINPMLFERTSTNPFKLVEREIPVDMPMGMESEFKLKMVIPPGYAVKETPKPYSNRLPGDDGIYARNVDAFHDTVTMTVRFDLSQTYFGPERYKLLRSFFEEIVAREAEQIVLAKVPAQAPKAPEKPAPASTPKRKK
jgi:hypothetical protein